MTLQAVLDEIAATSAFGVVAEVRAGDRVWRGAGGVAERGSTRPAPAGARFRAGSVTKSFVAVVVLQLVGEGRIGLDEPVGAGCRVTVRHLLQHTSGIADYGESERFRSLYGTTEAILGLRHRSWTAAELRTLVDGQPLLFEPGSSWGYSSTNYLLLGLLVERVTGRPYGGEVERRILRPLGLRNTELPGSSPYMRGSHLHGYLGEEDITVFDHSFAGAAGELVSSAADLNRFYRALMTGQLLDAAELAEMRTGSALGYGLGLATRQLDDGARLWGHNGGTFGYETFSWTTGDGVRQATVAVTPRAGGDTGSRMNQFVVAAFREGLSTAGRS
ncbi:serine hydrolase domain-containing protein [Actinoplanes sp. NPDC049596]|uniref:serine hydrolase domain-containing protein n=1 Tax=unclassified Actinoplanes TaxID=2626549 RepID=UPI003415B639